MIIYVLILIGVCLYKVKLNPHHSDYISVGQTESIKGVFAAIIFLSHLKQYIEPGLMFDNCVVLALRYIGQLMVAVFFFYSGFGIVRSYAAKEDYAKKVFKTRLLKTLIHFDIALLCYLPLALTTGDYQLSDYLFCWIGWTSLGNSNWFVFVIICMYAITGFVLWTVDSRGKGKQMLLLPLCVSCGCIVLWAALYLGGKESWWYNTLLCYPFGMWFAVLKEKFDRVIRKQLPRIGLALVTVAAFLIFYLIPNVAAYSLCACMFCLLIVLLNTWVKVENPVLRWLGKYAFSIYIFQRVPMLILTKMGLADNSIAFMLICLAATLVLAIVFEKIYKVVDLAIVCKNRDKK